jgi:hypothetical protein
MRHDLPAVFWDWNKGDKVLRENKCPVRLGISEIIYHMAMEYL